MVTSPGFAFLSLVFAIGPGPAPSPNQFGCLQETAAIPANAAAPNKKSRRIICASLFHYHEYTPKAVHWMFEGVKWYVPQKSFRARLPNYGATTNEPSSATYPNAIRAVLNAKPGAPCLSTKINPPVPCPR